MSLFSSHKFSLRLTVLGLVLFSSTAAFAQEKDRGFISDRPGASDNPLTSLPGHYRLEASLASTEVAVGNSGTDRRYSFGSFMFIAGTSQNSEIQIGVDGYQTQESGDSENGFGPTSLRYKYNLLGNTDPDGVGVALLPSVEHTGSLGENKTNLGFSVAINLPLPEDLSLGSSIGWTQTQNDGMETESSYSLPLVLGYELDDDHSLFAQVVADFDQNFRSTLSGGFGTAIIVKQNLELDAEFNYSEEDTVKNYEFMVGFTMLFEQ